MHEGIFMRNLFRNREILRFFVLLIFLIIIFSTAGFVINIITGIFSVVVGVGFSTLFFFFTYKRYAHIAMMSEEIDKILHGNDKFEVNEFAEGELSILHNEIQKMTVKLREQAENLKKDKIYLSESLADIAHQIRTPLTSINLLTSLLTKEKPSSEKYTELIREFETLTARIDWLVTALLKISKIDAKTVVFNMAEITADELIEKTLEPFIVLLEIRGINVEKSTGETCGKIKCDLSWTCEALGNIIKNCIEHTDNGYIKIEVTQNSIYTQIIISDNGAGFSDEDLPHIFERFYKSKKASDNNFGIGLALCKTILNNQNATIKAEKNNLGAKFVIRFYNYETI